MRTTRILADGNVPRDVRISAVSGWGILLKVYRAVKEVLLGNTCAIGFSASLLRLKILIINSNINHPIIFD